MIYYIGKSARQFKEPTDRMELEPAGAGRLQGGSCLEYEWTIPVQQCVQ